MPSSTIPSGMITSPRKAYFTPQSPWSVKTGLVLFPPNLFDIWPHGNGVLTLHGVRTAFNSNGWPDLSHRDMRCGSFDNCDIATVGSRLVGPIGLSTATWFNF